MNRRTKRTTPFLSLVTAVTVLPGFADEQKSLVSSDLNGGSQVRQIIVVFKTHFDIGYTDLVTNVLTRYRTQFADRALSVIEQSRSLPPEQQFTWTVPGYGP